MDADLKQHLEEMEARLRSNIEDLRSNTEGMEARLRSNTEEIVEARLTILETRLMAHTSQECEKVETKLLSEFFKWGRTSDMRTRQALENVVAFNDRIMALEDRVTSLERKPAA